MTLRRRFRTTISLRSVAAIAAGIAWMLLCLAATPKAAGETPTPSEDQVKALFLYNFAKFVDWPVDAFKDQASPIVIGILGDDPFGELIDNVTRGEHVRGREIVVRRISSPSDGRSCHILFISSSERKRIGAILDALRDARVLTVGEFDTFTQSGGMIRFTKENYRIGFEINQQPAAHSGLKISSKLLSLGQHPRTDGKDKAGS